MGDPIYEWQKLLDERQKKELDLAILYARDFHHGTTGHNQLMLIAVIAVAALIIVRTRNDR